MDIFDEARAATTRSLIEYYFAVPGAYWQNDEYWTLNPMRSDSHIGSFSVNIKGYYYDNATADSGDLIKFIAWKNNCSPKEAAEIIAGHKAGSEINSEYKTKKLPKEKPLPVYPIPESAIELLLQRIAKDENRYGKKTKIYRYHNKTGEVVSVTVRYETEENGKKSKNIIPYYWTGSYWSIGQAFKNNRYMYNLHLLQENKPVLIVEGEKCADTPVEGYTLVTWTSGAKSFKQTDWNPLKNKKIIFWPDNDNESKKSMDELAAILFYTAESIEMVTVPEGKPEHWDIADAYAENIDLTAFIEKHKSLFYSKMPEKRPLENKTEDIDLDSNPYIAIGYDEKDYCFYHRIEKEIKRFAKDSITASKLISLAPMRWWIMRGYTSKNDALATSRAASFIIMQCQEAGRIKKIDIKGSGFFELNNNFYANDGSRVIDKDNKEYSYTDFLPQKRYVIESNKDFFDFKELPASTNEEGEWLINIFTQQNFTSKIMGLTTLGWALFAPFCALFSWRPHLWISSAAKYGKSRLIEKFIYPLMNPFGLKTTGDISFAALRNQINNIGCPVIIDEMESDTERSKNHIEDLLVLIRNSSNDTSQNTSRADNSGGTIDYNIKSAFCCASVRSNALDTAYESRFLKVSLKDPKKHQKRTQTEEILRLKQIAVKFVRRSFSSISTIINDTHWLQIYLTEETHTDQRMADNMAPIISFLWHISHDISINSDLGRGYALSIINDIKTEKELENSDEEKLLETLFDAQIRDDNNCSRTVSEYLADVHKNITKDLFPSESAPLYESENLLARYGIKLCHTKFNGEKKLCLAIHSDSQQIKQLLRSTSWASSYKAILQRNSYCLTPTETKPIRMPGMRSRRCILLDWSALYQTYFEEDTSE